ncbi:MAG: methyltransferase domain-containing protein [Planctomycetota bacterium]|jgi:2-polyprenyl-3-methyl-5-hydroxy-6-metoxy-1,4-benzoquinol methylase
MTQTLVPPAAEPARPTFVEIETADEIARRLRVALLFAGWSQGADLAELLRRVPHELLREVDTIYAIPAVDDLDADEFADLRAEFPALKVLLPRFGGRPGRRLKLAMRCALRAGCDLIVTLRTDAGHRPEYLARLLAPFADEEVACVIGSRLREHAATVPFLHRLGLRLATGVQNQLLGSALSDPHSSFRAYRASTLATLPFHSNSDNLVFETELVIQHLTDGKRIEEVAVPAEPSPRTRRGVRYGWQSFRTVLRALANRLHLVYHPKFDLEGAKPSYRYKKAPTSLHQFVVRRHSESGIRFADVGAGAAGVSSTLHEAGAEVTGIDHRQPDSELPFNFVEADLNDDFAAKIVESLHGPADKVLALDVIEHLLRPEHGMAEIHRAMRPGGTLIASTANIAFLPIRVSLAMGQFNYGKRGILDVTHTRLFTIRSFCRALEGEGFRIDKIHGFGPPIEDVIGGSFVLRCLDRIAGGLARVWPSMFSYQFLVEATRLDADRDI